MFEQSFQIICDSEDFATFSSLGLCRPRRSLNNNKKKKINTLSLKWCGGPFVFFKAIDDYCFDSSKKTLHWTICVISLNHRHSQEDVYRVGR